MTKRAWLVLVALAACAEPPFSIPEWSLDPPHLSVGGLTDDEGQTLSQVVGAVLLPNDHLIIADHYVQGLREFDGEGRLLRTAGGQGEGPGEYQYIRGVARCDGANVVAFDLQWTLNVYDPELNWQSSRPAELPGLGVPGTPYRLDCEPGGHLIATGWGDTRTATRPGYFLASAPVVLVHGDELIHEFGDRLSSERYGTANEAGVLTGSGPHPFGRETEVAIGERNVFLGDASTYAVEVYDLSGTLVDSIIWSGPSRDITEADYDRYIADAVADAPPERHASIRSRLSEVLPSVTAFPAYDELRVDDRGDLWVRHFPRPGAEVAEWMVFGVDRGPTGSLRVPVSWTILDVVGDRVVYLERDDLDVEAVHVARLVR